MTAKKLTKIEEIEQYNLKHMQGNKKKLQEALDNLKKVLNDNFYDNVYDFSEQGIQIEFIEVVKRLFHPKAIVETGSNGQTIKKIITKSLDHNNADKSFLLDKIYANYIFQKNSNGKTHGVDSREIPPAEFKSTKNKTINKLNIFHNMPIGQIDKVDEKEDGKHNIYNPSSKVSLVCGIFENNSITPIIVFYIKYTDFQSIISKLISKKSTEYKNSISEIATINEKIKAKEYGYRVGDTVQLSHLTNPTIIKGNKENPILIQTPRDTLTLKLGDFINASTFKIIHLNENWKHKLCIDSAIIKQNRNFINMLNQFYTEDEFAKLFSNDKKEQAVQKKSKLKI